MLLIKHKSASVSDHAAKKRQAAAKDIHTRDRQTKDSPSKDQRVVRTQRQLDAAFVELLHRRSYGNIRVSDITKKAKVGRATFYAHYASKDDLLRSQFARIVAPMLALRPDEACPLDATAFFAHVLSSARIYKALIGGVESGAAPTVLRDCFEERVRQALHQRKNPAALPTESAMRQAIISRVVASSMLAVIECAMESNSAPSPQEAQAILRKFVGGGLTALRTSDSRSPAAR
jgi:AcrR family transcriptional regulator